MRSLRISYAPFREGQTLLQQNVVFLRRSIWRVAMNKRRDPQFSYRCVLSSYEELSLSYVRLLAVARDGLPPLFFFFLSAPPGCRLCTRAVTFVYTGGAERKFWMFHYIGSRIASSELDSEPTLGEPHRWNPSFLLPSVRLTAFEPLYIHVLF